MKIEVNIDEVQITNMVQNYVEKNCHKMVIEALRKDVSETLEKMADTNRYNKLILDECDKLLHKEIVDTLTHEIHRYGFDILPYEKLSLYEKDKQAEEILANKHFVDGIVVGFNIVNHGGLCDYDKERIETMVFEAAGRYIAQTIKKTKSRYKELVETVTKELSEREETEDV